uniref:MULE transposase domain-containing protein n=1 Tax=Ditylenchus dipsaci TaxID=166011 RepID=A0A915DDV2_9BILA
MSSSSGCDFKWLAAVVRLLNKPFSCQTMATNTLLQQSTTPGLRANCRPIVGCWTLREGDNPVCNDFGVRTEGVEWNTPNVTNVPFLRQIQNFSAYQKKSDLSPSTLEDLRDYAASKQNVPANEDEVFVCNIQARKSNSMDEFCLVWSTNKLRSLQSSCAFISVDSTYNLNWNRYPVMVAGFGDSNKQFFLTHIALASNENGWCYEVFF